MEPMKINPQIQELIAKKVLANAVEREPSGRLAAGKLGWPLQWQMLHHLKVKPKVNDEYTLRKFARGKDVEDRVVEWIAPARYQEPVSYRGVAGVVDMVLEYPIEVKSCTNMAFKHRQKDGIGRSHRLQAELYAKALGYSKFAVAYVASDDYRVLCIEEEVTGEVDKVIDEYEAQLIMGTVPTFLAHEKWHGMKDYSPYPDWMKLDDEGIAEKLSSLGMVVPVGLPLGIK